MYVSLVFFAKFQGQKVHLGFIYFDCTCIYANSSMRKRFNTGREYYLTIFCLNVIIHLTQVAFLVTHFANCWSFLLRRPIFMYVSTWDHFFHYRLYPKRQSVNTQPEWVGLLKLFVQIKRRFLLSLVDNETPDKYFQGNNIAQMQDINSTFHFIFQNNFQKHLIFLIPFNTDILCIKCTCYD